MSIEVRKAESDADLEAWARVKRAVLPNESAWSVQEFRERAVPDRLVLVADLDGETVGAGLAALSDVQGRGFVAPRVHPDARRRGVGTAMLLALTEHVVSLGFDKAWATADDRRLSGVRQAVRLRRGRPGGRAGDRPSRADPRGAAPE